MQPMSDSRLRPYAAIASSVSDIDVAVGRKRADRVRASRGWAVHTWLALACGAAFPAACASVPAARPEAPRAMSPSEEAEAIEVARRHPIAQTYDRPRDPQALPVRPPPVPTEAPPAPPPPPVAQNPAPETSVAVPPPPQDQVIIVGNDSPSPSTTTTYVWPEADRPDDGYVWVDGTWVARPRVRAYVGAYPSWHHHYRRPWVYPAPVIVVPEHRHWNGHHHRPPAPRPRYYSAPSVPRYHSPLRRQVYVAPPASSRDRSAVRNAPPARSRGEVHSAPPSRRSVRVR